MKERMSFDEMISALDTACGMLIVTALKNDDVYQAMNKVQDVSIALEGWAWAEEVERN